MRRLFQSRVFQIVFGLLLSFVVLGLFFYVNKSSSLYKLLSYIAGPDFCRYLIDDWGAQTAAVVTLLFLLVSFVSHAGRLPWFGRSAYPVSLREGSCGALGKRRFQPDEDEKKDLERMPGGFWGAVLGITAYRRGNGSLLFVARERAKISDVLGRLLVALAVTALCSQPLLVLAEAVVMGSDVSDNLVVTALAGTTDWLSSWFPSDDGDTADPATDDTAAIEDTTAEPETPDETESDTTADNTSEPETDADDTTGADADTEGTESSGSISGWISEKASGISEWFGGLFSDETLLPSSERGLTEEDIAGMDYDDIQLAINELYARHGYDFSNSSSQSGQKAAEYFSKQDWYEPDESLSMAEAEAQFSEIEWANLLFLSARRRELQ